MKMSFELDPQSGHIHVPVYANGQGPFSLTLDTGGVRTTLSGSIVNRLGVETYAMEKASAMGVGGSVPVKGARLAKMSLGQLTFEDEEILVMDFDRVFGPCRNGIVGHSTLKDFLVSIDYVHNTLSMERTNGSSGRIGHQVEWLDFQYMGATHLMLVPVRINGKGPYPLVLDTGSSGVVINPKLAAELGLEATPPQEEEGCSGGKCVGVGGVVMGRATRVNDISVGSTSKQDMTVAIIDLSQIAPKGKAPEYGIIGYPYLRDLRLLIDYPNRRFALMNA